MTAPYFTEKPDWWKHNEPTEEEQHVNGGLQVEDWPHARQVMCLSTQLFEATLSLHYLDRSALYLLERAAFLHNAGTLIEQRHHHKHSFRLIKETSLPDFTDEERHEIACIARYHRRALPSKDHREFAALSPVARKRVSSLAALLRIADALDYHHDSRILHLAADPTRCNTTTWTISLWVDPLVKLDQELEIAHKKANLFEREFKHKMHFVTLT